MSENEVAVVVKFFANPSVAALKVISGVIRKGDLLNYKGATTDFTEAAVSMEMNNQPVEEARPGDMVGIQVKERVRENDKVYKVVD